MIRIISGELKGRRILAPKNFDVRPTTDFAKEAFFSIITNYYQLSEIAVLDLFSGIGSMSYEFASRGCKDITSVEQNAKHTKFIQETLVSLNINNQVNIIKQDVFSFLSKESTKTFDIIFADPPFNLDIESYQKIVNLVFKNHFISQEGELILEHESRKNFSQFPFFKEMRKYGNVRFSFFDH